MTKLRPTPVSVAMGLPACPDCHAFRGDPCRTPSNRTCFPHAGRATKKIEGGKLDEAAKRYHYLLVVSPGPLMIFRVPWPMPPWRSILRASTAVMQSHGLRKKDIHSLDGLVPYPEDRTVEDHNMAKRVDEGCEGAWDPLRKFWLYDWKGGAFNLCRAAS